MKTAKELNLDILKMTVLIQERFPELAKNIGEMPVEISDTADPGVNIKNLEDYYESLNILFKKYSLGHIAAAKGSPPVL